ncbi:conserved exported hypothetical protein [Gammaproteobacteria bacterium]
MIKTGMKLVVATAAVLGMTLVAMAETISGGSISGSAGGVQIQGNTTINASAENVNTMSSGSNSTATAKIGGISGGTQIQGNTTITASGKNVNTTSTGSTSKACSEVGNVGDTAGCK